MILFPEIDLYTRSIRFSIMADNKNILIVSECFFPEEFKINDLAVAWKNKGYAVDVLTLVPSYPLVKCLMGIRIN